MQSLFYEAYSEVMKHEGGYVNDPDDIGGETYCGISRRFHPRWRGWGAIDHIKSGKKIQTNTIFPGLKDIVQEFYKLNYWDSLSLDEISEYQLVCDMFDTAVNCGVNTSGKFLQRALNILNNRENLWEDIKVDGIIGKKSIEMVYKAFLANRASLLINVFNVIRGALYVSILERKETQEKFAWAWFNRLHFV